MMPINQEVTALSKKLTVLYPHAASIIAWQLLSFITGKSPVELIAHTDLPLTVNQKTHLDTIMYQLLEEHKPLAYIIGSVPFLSLDIKVEPPILIPRPETEYWCSIIIEQLEELPHKNLTILDLCTGSGCIGLSLAHALPKAHVYAVDQSVQACNLARVNAGLNGIANMSIIQSDLFTNLPKIQFDLIVSNPPYISAEEWLTLEESVRSWEDPAALLAEQEGLELLKKILDQSAVWLRCNKEMRKLLIPQLVLEIGHTQGEAVAALCKNAGFKNVGIHKDLTGRDRFVTAQDGGSCE